MRSDKIAISVHNLTKTYRIFGHPGDRIKQALTLGRVRFHREFTALQGVSFEIKKGETVGLIGRNGSGKSTLLQLICGILKPTSGSVTVNGRISALLELGAGFNPEFTGRENVYFQGALMGLAKEEMDERFDDIAAFADIGEFIDQPVRTYSSGMFVRLAFAVAVHVDADILVIDEALSVGDIFFQQKSISRIKQLKEAGVTILFVSHSLPVVKSFCSKALHLAESMLVGFGETKSVCDAYQNESTSVAVLDRTTALALSQAGAELLESQAAAGVFREDAGLAARLSRRSGSQEAEVVAVETLDSQGRATTSFGPTPEITFRIHIRVNQSIQAGAAVGLLISNRNGVDLVSLNSDKYNQRLAELKPRGGCVYEMTVRLPFSAGSYSVDVGLKPSPAGSCFYDRCFNAAVFEIASNPEGFEGYALPIVLQPREIRFFQESHT